MKKNTVPIYISEIDEKRFGIKVAKTDNMALHDIPSIMSFCKENKVRLLLARCSTRELPLVQALENKGFLLMDTLLYYFCNLRKNPPPEYASEIKIRPCKFGEEEIIKSIAAEAFDGYRGHYHADSMLNKKKSNEVYADWAYRSCLHTEKDSQVFVAELKDKIIGFGVVRINSPDEGQGLLFGVLKKYQGRGAYRMIIINCMRWCLDRNIEKITIATQITNIASQKVWIRLGFEPSHSYYTFHKWFEED